MVILDLEVCENIDEFKNDIIEIAATLMDMADASTSWLDYINPFNCNLESTTATNLLMEELLIETSELFEYNKAESLIELKKLVTKRQKELGKFEPRRTLEFYFKQN